MAGAGMSPAFSAPTFNEFAVRMPDGFDETYRQLMEKNIVAGVPLEPYYPELAGYYLFCATETATREDMDLLVREVTS
jgi:glycine dehydrogenase subunit 1